MGLAGSLDPSMVCRDHRSSIDPDRQAHLAPSSFVAGQDQSSSSSSIVPTYQVHSVLRSSGVSLTCLLLPIGSAWRDHLATATIPIQTWRLSLALSLWAEPEASAAIFRLGSSPKLEDQSSSSFGYTFVRNHLAGFPSQRTVHRQRPTWHAPYPWLNQLHSTAPGYKYLYSAD